MKRPLCLLLFFFPLLVVVAPVRALERTEVRADRDPAVAWDAGATCSVTYANTCTGWLWLWSDFVPYDVIGVVFEPCCPDARLVASQVYFWSGIGGGWGFTGTIAVRDVVDDCLGESYAQVLTPPWPGSHNLQWEGIPAGPVAVTWRHGAAVDWGGGGGNSQGPSFVSDHPAAGPTGPAACGFCFPSTRPTHSFLFGQPESLLCPPEPLNDGTCNAEFVFWSAHFACNVGVESSSWGMLKNLYR